MVNQTGKPPDEKRQGVKQVEVKKIGSFAILAMFFTECCSGPYGVEEMVGDAGPGVALMLLILVPIVWGYPFALLTTEMTEHMPVEGGSEIWIQEGLGEFWFGLAITKDYLWSLSCNATYIVLAVGYLQNGLEHLDIPMTNLQVYLLKIGVVVVLLFINFLGLKEVSVVTTVIAVLTLSTFLIITIIGFSQAEQNPIEPFVNPDYEGYPINAWTCELAVALWMYSAFDDISMFAGEVEGAEEKIPKGAVLVIPVMAAIYVLPTLAGLSANIGDFRFWSEEPWGIGWHDIMLKSPVAPEFFGLLFSVVAFLSLCSLYNMCIVVGSRCGLVLSEYNFGPQALTRLTKKRGQPYVSMLSLVIVTILLFGTPNFQLSFSFLVMFEAFFMVLHVCLTAVTAAKLKRLHKYDHAKFRVPGGMKGHNLAVGSLLFFSAIFVLGNGIAYYLVCIMVMLLLPIVYVVCKIRWKGLTASYPRFNPIDKRTHLAFGDLIKIGAYYLGFGILGFLGKPFFSWYEEDQVVGYHVTQEQFANDMGAQMGVMMGLDQSYKGDNAALLENIMPHIDQFTTSSGNIYVPGYYEYTYAGNGFLSDFYAMIEMSVTVGIIATIIGVVVLAIGFYLRKTDHIQLDALKAAGEIDDVVGSVHIDQEKLEAQRKKKEEEKKKEKEKR